VAKHKKNGKTPEITVISLVKNKFWWGGKKAIKESKIVTRI
jgi:hypothetical protein|tara:strand:+ start:1927 stop:2049 length:123 start_codon:yes stop_codon:yes gene_type:complete